MPARARTGGLLISPPQRLLPAVLLTGGPASSRVEPRAITLCALPSPLRPPSLLGCSFPCHSRIRAISSKSRVPETSFLCPSLPEALSWFGGWGDPCRAKAPESSLGWGEALGRRPVGCWWGRGPRVRGKKGIWLNLKLYGIPVGPGEGCLWEVTFN